MTNKAKFLVSMKMLCDYFRQPLSETALEGYWIALSDIDDDAVNVAVTQALRESKFFPSGSELRTYAGVLPRDYAAEASLCWEKVRRSIDRYDYMIGSIDFGPRVNAVISNLGGWDVLCRASLPELDSPGWLRKRFCEVYEQFAPMDPDKLRGEPLSGCLPPKWRDEPKHIAVKIAGQPESKALPAVNRDVRELLEGLADAKS